MYAGTSGRTHGEMNDTRPARKITPRVNAPPLFTSGPVPTFASQGNSRYRKPVKRKNEFVTRMRPAPTTSKPATISTARMYRLKRLKSGRIQFSASAVTMNGMPKPSE